MGQAEEEAQAKELGREHAQEELRQELCVTEAQDKGEGGREGVEAI